MREKPLYSNQALTSVGREFMSRVTAPRGFHCDKSANGMKPDVKLLRRAAERVSAHLSLFRRAAAQQLQNLLGNAAFLATAANEPPVAGPIHHLFDDRGKDGKDGKDMRANRAFAPDSPEPRPPWRCSARGCSWP